MPDDIAPASPRDERPVPSMPGWQPIESAPKDGRHVIVGHAAEQWRCEARYIPGIGWYEFNNEPTDSWGRELSPTHWQPLPDPPK